VLARDPVAKRMFSVRKRSANVATANVLTVRKHSDSNNKLLIGRPQESAQLERKSTTRNGDEPKFLN